MDVKQGAMGVQYVTDGEEGRILVVRRKKRKEEWSNGRSDNNDGEVDVSNSRNTNMKRGITYQVYMFGMEAPREMCAGHLSSPLRREL